ncbi:hypothetical protein MKY87_15375 [Paenibacillus sp. FSL R7-0198]|uniref:HNH endonuclease n=1 Tax=Paenibacillus sp. FSL R7-0198 TaxID=2921674 RepID=UPI0030F6BF43
MLFPYQYINHSMEKMHQYIEYIFFEVWCKAPCNEYDISLFDYNEEIKEIIKEFHYTAPKGADFFTKGIHEIFTLFKMLSVEEINQLRVWFQSNNDIERLCMNDTLVPSITYSELEKMNEDLSSKMKAFFTGLYSHDFLSLKAISSKIGVIDNHYKEFVKINRNSKCPYCGLQSIDGQYVHTREAYDHYFPKSKYPFSSINFMNLSPACYKCNSGNKGAKDPLYDKNGKRRKAFYSYNATPYNIEIAIRLNSIDIKNIIPDDVTINFGPVDLAEELGTWNDLFNIEERYIAECCSVDALYWIEQVYEECVDKSPGEFLKIKLEVANKYPFSDKNFLRKPFLEACNSHKIFG